MPTPILLQIDSALKPTKVLHLWEFMTDYLSFITLLK